MSTPRMQIHEIYSQKWEEGPDHFYGRWLCQIERTSMPKDQYTESFFLNIHWNDLFEHEKPGFVETEDLGYEHCKYTPLNKRYGIIHYQGSDGRFFQPAEMLWDTREYNSEDCFNPDGDYNDGHEDWNILVDEANAPDATELNFLFYAYDYPTHVHCKFETSTLQISKIGESIELPPSDFYCLHLNGWTLSGLSLTLDTISRYDLKSRTYLIRITVHGLPPTIRFVDSERGIEGMTRGHLREACAWSNDKLFVWSEEKEGLAAGATKLQVNKATRSQIHYIDLTTGLATPLSHTFQQPIGRLAIGADNNLYVRNDEIIQRTAPYDDLYIWDYHYLRIPLNGPDSLFFLAAAAIPRPLSEKLEEIIKQHREPIPLMRPPECHFSV